MANLAVSQNKKQPKRLKIVGMILSENYQRSKIFAQKLHKHHKKNFLYPSIQGFLETDWLQYLNTLQRHVGGQTWAVRKGVVVFIDSRFIGGEQELMDYFRDYMYTKPTEDCIKAAARKEYVQRLNHNSLIYSYLEFALAGEYMGSMVFELRPDLLPKTSSWFAFLCDENNHTTLSYKNTTVHRVCKSGWFQAGDLKLPQSGFLEDESYCYKHDQRGILSFANDGKHTNRTQFFVTFKPSSWMDEYYVAFGRLVEGCDVLRRIEYTECIYESPVQEIKIINCGMADVGLGKSLVTKVKIKGITSGDPHIDLEMFMDLIFDWFCEVLFERLDKEVKDKLHGEWFAEMLWDMVLQKITLRRPIDDTMDLKDTSSYPFLPERYLAGLYSLRDIPDHYIMGLLGDIIEEAVNRSDTREMAESIIGFIIRNIDIKDSDHKDLDSQIVVASVLNYLIQNVNRILFGSEPSSPQGTSETGLIQESLTKISSENLEKASGSKVQVPPPSTDNEEDHQSSGGRVSTKQSVVRFILESLFKTLSGLEDK